MVHAVFLYLKKMLTPGNNAFLQQKTVITLGNILFLSINRALSIGYTVKKIKNRVEPLDIMLFSYTISSLPKAFVVFVIMQRI